MGDPLKHPSKPPAHDAQVGDAPEGTDEEVTGVHLRERGRHSGFVPSPRGDGRPYAGAILLVPLGCAGGQRRYLLGLRPGRRLGWVVLGWLLLMATAGASLRVGLGPAHRPLILGWARVRQGTTALLPLTGWARVPDAERVPPDPREAAKRARKLELGTRPVASQLLRGEVDRRWVREAERLGATPTRFLWPVARGWYVRGFGSGTGGYHLAVDVAGEEGSTVRAAADGLVAYADDGVRGFGNLLMLVHGGGFVTMYAHNQSHGVEPGDFVRAGEPIATLGNTGISRGPHVHFELIHERRNCDPVPLFEPGVRHRERGFDTSRTTTWEGSRPRAVRCERRRRHPHSRWADGPVADAELHEEVAPGSHSEQTAEPAQPQDEAAQEKRSAERRRARREQKAEAQRQASAPEERQAPRDEAPDAEPSARPKAEREVEEKRPEAAQAPVTSAPESESAEGAEPAPAKQPPAASPGNAQTAAAQTATAEPTAAASAAEVE